MTINTRRLREIISADDILGGDVSFILQQLPALLGSADVICDLKEQLAYQKEWRDDYKADAKELASRLAHEEIEHDTTKEQLLAANAEIERLKAKNEDALTTFIASQRGDVLITMAKERDAAIASKEKWKACALMLLDDIGPEGRDACVLLLAAESSASARGTSV